MPHRRCSSSMARSTSQWPQVETSSSASRWATRSSSSGSRRRGCNSQLLGRSLPWHLTVRGGPVVVILYTRGFGAAARQSYGSWSHCRQMQLRDDVPEHEAQRHQNFFPRSPSFPLDRGGAGGLTSLDMGQARSTHPLSLEKGGCAGAAGLVGADFVG